MQLGDKPGDVSMVERYGMIPFRITHPGQAFTYKDVIITETEHGPRAQIIERSGEPSAVPAILTLLTCVFLHGGWMHFLGNMLFLYIFGDNVEDCFGHLGYLAMYLACGILASLSHYITDPASTVPCIGASGAIAGVMGGYFLLYPHSKVMTLIPVFGFLQMVMLPSYTFLGIWFLIQTINGVGGLASGTSTGVAWWAHIGGFVAGYVAGWFLNATHHLRPQVQERRPLTQQRSSYRFRSRR